MALNFAGIPSYADLALTLEDVAQLWGSADIAKSTTMHVAGMALYFVGFRSEEKDALAGESSSILTNGYLGQAASPGGAAPATIRHSLCNCAVALQIDWPLGRALINAACAIESGVAPKQAPATSIATIKLPECVAINKEVSPSNRQFAAGILLMSFGSLRFSDPQRIKTLEAKSDSACGTLIRCKTKNPHGLDWPRAFPLMGMTGAAEWIEPILT